MEAAPSPPPPLHKPTLKSALLTYLQETPVKETYHTPITILQFSLASSPDPRKQAPPALL